MRDSEEQRKMQDRINAMHVSLGRYLSDPVEPNSGTGWYEWFKMPENTTEIAYVHESGEVFDPARGWNPIEFTIASAEGRVHKLVRADGSGQ